MYRSTETRNMFYYFWPRPVNCSLARILTSVIKKVILINKALCNTEKVKYENSEIAIDSKILWFILDGHVQARSSILEAPEGVKRGDSCLTTSMKLIIEIKIDQPTLRHHNTVMRTYVIFPVIVKLFLYLHFKINQRGLTFFLHDVETEFKVT